jgi:hypothetical protein
MDKNLLVIGGVDYAFQSEAQQRYFEVNKATLEKQGIDVKGWEESSRGLKLPQRAP